MDFPNVHILPQSNYLRLLHSIIRDRGTGSLDFAFYSNRIFRMLLDFAINLLPFEPFNVTTPVGEPYEGVRPATDLCSVSVIRAGEGMETEARCLYRDMRIGKILIQRDPETKQPKLYFSKLPDDIARCHVLLLEPMLATGGSAMTAIKVLLEAGVPEDQIIFVNVLVSPEGLRQVVEAFPSISIVTSAVERGLNDRAFMVPGIGDFGDRYFRTSDMGAV